MRYSLWPSIARLLTGAVLGASPGIVLFLVVGNAWTISLTVLGAFAGLGLALPATSAYEVFRHVVWEVFRVPLPEDERPRSDVFGGWVLRGKPNRIAARSIPLGAVCGLISGGVFLGVDLSLYLQQGESYLLPQPRVPPPAVYIFTYIQFVAYASALFGLFVFGSHWKPILVFGSFGFAVAFFVGLGVAPAERCLWLGLLGGSIGLGLGALLGWLIVSEE